MHQQHKWYLSNIIDWQDNSNNLKCFWYCVKGKCQDSVGIRELKNQANDMVTESIEKAEILSIYYQGHKYYPFLTNCTQRVVLMVQALLPTVWHQESHKDHCYVQFVYSYLRKWYDIKHSHKTFHWWLLSLLPYWFTRYFKMTF